MHIEKTTIEHYIDAHWNEILEDIQQMVVIPSTMDKERATSGQPWGPNVTQALTKILDIASRLGFATHNYEGYVGCADLRQTTSSRKNKKQIAVFFACRYCPCWCWLEL